MMNDFTKLIEDLSFEVNDEVEAAREVLEDGELQDGTKITAEKQESITEMIEHVERASKMATQLNELAEKADEILKEDKVHLVNEISTEAMQMCYANILDNMGLQDITMSFESSDPVHALSFLAVAARKQAAQAEYMEAQILDFSPEGKIYSFFRRDEARLASARAKIQEASEDSNLKDLLASSTWWDELSGWLLDESDHYRMLFRGNRMQSDPIGEVNKDLKVLIDAAKHNREMIEIAQQVAKLDDSQSAKAESLLKHVKPSNLTKYNFMSNIQVVSGKPKSNERARPLHGGWITFSSIFLFGPLLSVTVGSLINAGKIDVELKRSNVKLDHSKLKETLRLMDEMDSIFDRNQHMSADLNVGALKGAAAAPVKAILKVSINEQEVIYEIAFKLLRGIGRILSKLRG